VRRGGLLKRVGTGVVNAAARKHSRRVGFVPVRRLYGFKGPAELSGVKKESRENCPDDLHDTLRRARGPARDSTSRST
jgi:hypothetical protein